MSIAYRVQDYIADRRIALDRVAHDASSCALDTAHRAHVPADHVAKAIVLEGRHSGYLMVVIAANQRLDLRALAEDFGDDFVLVRERKLTEMFPDCAPGAVPAIGDAYGIPTWWDRHLADWNDVYFEGGDHRTLVHLSGTEFADVMRAARPLHAH